MEMMMLALIAPPHIVGKLAEFKGVGEGCAITLL